MFCFVLLLAVLAIKPKSSPVLGKCRTTELHLGTQTHFKPCSTRTDEIECLLKVPVHFDILIRLLFPSPPPLPSPLLPPPPLPLPFCLLSLCLSLIYLQKIPPSVLDANPSMGTCMCGSLPAPLPTYPDVGLSAASPAPHLCATMLSAMTKTD